MLKHPPLFVMVLLAKEEKMREGVPPGYPWLSLAVLGCPWLFLAVCCRRCRCC